jgi:hypothetical protein
MPTQPQPDTQVMPQTMTSEPPKSVGIE